MFKEFRSSNYLKFIDVANQLLSIDYTFLYAHYLLSQAYLFIGDTVNSNKYKDIELGLTNSIFNSGNGKSCKSGWYVIQVSEEYYILQKLNAKVKGQSVGNGGNCDIMNVEIDGDSKTFYFDITKEMEGEQKMFLGK